MIARYVTAKRTPLTFEQAREALAAALRSGETPVRREVLALALAKCALETGRFTKIYNYNFGNIKAGAKYTGMYTCLPLLNEQLADGWHWFAPEGEVRRDAKSGKWVPVGSSVAVPPGHPQTRMRAHANRFDGAFAYADFMRDRPVMWNALQLGEPRAFVRAMKAGRYMTADEGPYADSVASLYREFSLKLEGRNPDETRLEESVWSAARIEALVTTTAARSLEGFYDD